MAINAIVILASVSRVTFAQSVTVEMPNGGETWFPNSTHKVTWTSVGLTNVLIRYSTDGGGSWTQAVASTDAAAGYYEWTLPNANSGNCLVEVADALDGTPADQSDLPFTISFAGAGVFVDAPLSGDRWPVGSSRNIEWTSFNVTNVRIELSRDGGSAWEDIVASTPATGSPYSWIPVIGPGSTNCLVRVSDADSPINSPLHYSGVFKIEDIVVTQPNGTEVWDVGTSQSVTWTSTALTDVRIELSRDGGTTWEDIVASTPAAAGSYTWPSVTAPVSGNCLVRVSDAADASPSDVSAAPFEIALTLQTVAVTVPNGGETWDVGSTHDITWASSGLTDVRIELSRDGGSTWEDVIASTPVAAGSYTWTSVTIPDSTNCVVRISDAADGSPSDVSDAPFIIGGTAPQLTTINVTPATVTMPTNGTQDFTAEARDQFGDPFAATVDWTVDAGGAVNPVTATTTTFTSDGTEETFTVTATAGSVSGTATVTVTSGPAPPGAFDMTSPGDGSLYQGLGPTLEWDASQFASTYTLVLADNAGFTGPLVDDSTIAATTYTVPGGTLATETTYYWKVTASNALGDTPASSSYFSFTTTAAPVVQLVEPSDNAHIIGKLTLKASATDDVSVEHVEFYVDGVPVGDGLNTAGSTWELSWDSSSIGDGDYTVVAEATDGVQVFTMSAGVSISVENDEDWDGDGYTNIEELKSGTDPWDPRSFESGAARSLIGTGCLAPGGAPDSANRSAAAMLIAAIAALAAWRRKRRA